MYVVGFRLWLVKKCHNHLWLLINKVAVLSTASACALNAIIFHITLKFLSVCSLIHSKQHLQYQDKMFFALFLQLSYMYCQQTIATEFEVELHAYASIWLALNLLGNVRQPHCCFILWQILSCQIVNLMFMNGISFDSHC